MKIEIDISTDDIVKHVADRVLDIYTVEYDEDGNPIERSRNRTLTDQIQREVTLMVRKHVEEQTKAVTAEVIKTEVAKVLEAGWQPTDSWGSPTGEVLTLSRRISDILDSVRGDRGYGNDRKKLVDIVIEEKVREAMGGELKKVVDTATAKLRADLDGLIAGKFTEAIKGAFGIR